MEERFVTSDIRERVLTLTLNRPKIGNAWSLEMEKCLREELLKSQFDDRIRAIVITGAGNSFCVGRSLSSLSKTQTTIEDPNYGSGDLEQRMTYLAGIDKPILAAINGGVAGIGFVLSLYCDIRFMADGAKLSTSFARRGLIAEEGSAWILPRLIGRMNAADLLFSARKVDAAGAEKLGLVRCLPRAGFLSAVQEYASELANLCSPRSIRLIKAQIWASDRQSLNVATHRSQELMLTCKDSSDFAEGIAHFAEKRPPVFTGK